MNCAALQPVAVARQPLHLRMATALAGIPDAVAAAWARASRRSAGDRVAAEHEALCGLSARVLRDIGASPSLIAEAAECARDDLRAELDRPMY